MKGKISNSGKGKTKWSQHSKNYRDLHDKSFSRGKIEILMPWVMLGCVEGCGMESECSLPLTEATTVVVVAQATVALLLCSGSKGYLKAAFLDLPLNQCSGLVSCCKAPLLPSYYYSLDSYFLQKL